MRKSNSASPIPTSAGLLVPWGHKLIVAIDDESETMPRCSRCGLYATYRLLGHGVDGSVCFDCNKEVTKGLERLRSYREAMLAKLRDRKAA